MPLPSLPKNVSLAVVEDNLVYTESKLLAAQHKSEAAKLSKLISACAATYKGQREHRHEVVRANARVAAADDALDDLLGRFIRTCAELPDGRAVLDSYCGGRTPSELARPVLGDELAAMKKWPSASRPRGCRRSWRWAPYSPPCSSTPTTRSTRVARSRRRTPASATAAISMRSCRTPRERACGGGRGDGHPREQQRPRPGVQLALLDPTTSAR